MGFTAHRVRNVFTAVWWRVGLGFVRVHLCVAFGPVSGWSASRVRRCGGRSGRDERNLLLRSRRRDTSEPTGSCRRGRELDRCPSRQPAGWPVLRLLPVNLNLILIAPLADLRVADLRVGEFPTSGAAGSRPGRCPVANDLTPLNAVHAGNCRWSARAAERFSLPAAFSSHPSVSSHSYAANRSAAR